MLPRSFVLFSTLLLCDGYKLLVVFPFPNMSHAILGEGFVRHLLQAGHEVTYITPILLKNATDGLRQIDVSDNIKNLPTDVFDVEKMLRKEFDLEEWSFWTKIIVDIMEVTYKSKTIQDFLSDPSEEFDAVIVEWLFNELGAGFASIFKCPLIWSISMVPHSYSQHLIDEHLNPSYNINVFSTKYSFDFLDRVHNLWYLIKVLYFKWNFIARETKIYEDVFNAPSALRGRELTPYDEIRYNASLMLGNSNVCVGEGIAFPQNYKDIGGYHVQLTPAPLPQHLQAIMDSSKNGVIYFSLGSLLRPDKIPNALKRGLINMFAELKQTVIWKLGENFTDLPNNVHIVSWAPQQSILAHPNTVLFITHGGLLSTIETVIFGVPIIGMPFFADQPLNVERAQARGFGKRIELNDNSPIELRKAINEMITNPRYHRRAKELSAIYHDRLVPPGSELVFWVEHVIRTGGAAHLRSRAMQMAWYKKMYLDLAVIILITAAIIVYISIFFIRPKAISKMKKNV